MFCNKCGKELSPGVKFCQSCGNPIGDTHTNLSNNNVVEVKPSNGDGIVNVEKTSKKKSILPIILIIIGVLFLLIIGLVVALVFIFNSVSSNSNKLVCESKEGNITIMYNDSTITGYTVSGGITYDFDTQKKLADQKGGEAYIDEFNKWFENNTSGSCRKEVLNSSELIENTGSDNNLINSDYKTVGENKFGYIDIPKDWINFHDIDGTHSIQFSYANLYIVTLDYVENSPVTSKAAAESIYNEKKNDSSLSNVSIQKYRIGNQKYIGYKVSMYYIKENVYLDTYWFDIPGDPNLHYIALEGPKGYEQYNNIIDSFKIVK